MLSLVLSTSGGATDLAGTVTVTATPSEPITKVEFYVDNVLASTDTSSPYTHSLDTTLLSSGDHQLKAKAFYPRNKVATTKLDVTVFNPSIPVGEEEMLEESYPVVVE